MTIWIGRSSLVSKDFKRAGSRNINVSRLYEGTRRANPRVRMSASNTVLVQSEEIPRLVLLAASRDRAVATRSERILRFSSQMVLLSTFCSAAQSYPSITVSDELPVGASR